MHDDDDDNLEAVNIKKNNQTQLWRSRDNGFLRRGIMPD